MPVVLPSVRTCSPFEEGILWVIHPSGIRLGVKGEGSNIARGEEPAHDATPFWNLPHPLAA